MIDLYIGDRPNFTDVFRIGTRVRGANTNTQFEVGLRISSGGNGVVHNCIDSNTGDEFAIKFQLKTYANRSRRFQREVRIMQSLDHSHLIRYLDNGVAQAQASPKSTKQISFVVMELAKTSLSSLIQNNRASFPYELYIGQFRGLASALRLLHSRAIHRDIKPENILVVGDRWVLSDFGLCAPAPYKEVALTHEREPVGPRYWMSPEAVNRVLGCKDVPTKASDVFQLASVFWYAVTGRHPLGIVGQQDWRGPTPLYEVLVRCLAHRPSARPADGDAFYAALEDAIIEAVVASSS